MVKHEIVKTKSGYILILEDQDGNRNDYRFESKKALNNYLKRVGLK